MKLRFIFILLIFFTASSSGCKKNRTNPVPSIPFDITININLPTYNALTNVGGWAYVEGGSKGIVVYRASLTEFVAFDRHSPANDGTCPDPLVENEDNFLQLDDLCNDAHFSMIDGSPISGSDYGLRKYATFFDGQDNLRIYN